jgi:hypothetical protein
LFRRSLALLWQDFVPLVLLGGAAVLPYLWVMFTRIDLAPLHRVAPEIPAGISANFTASRVASFLIRCFCEVLILSIAFQRLRRLPVRLRALPGAGLRFVLPVTAISICRSVGLLIGDVFLHRPGWVAPGGGVILVILPSLALAMIWFVAPSVCVIERLGAVASLRRSAALTSGQRWKIFGLFLAMAIPGIVAGVIANRILAATGSQVLYAGLEYATQGIYIALSCIVLVVVYAALNAAKEGAVSDRIAAIFE